MIGVIDYGMGNLRSVEKALQAIGARAGILRDPGVVEPSLSALILPGVGAFADGMRQLNKRGWTPAIKAWVREGRPLLGICLGMQLLFESSTEDAPADDQPVPGLALLPGRVVRFTVDRRAADGWRLKVPHMGWNALSWTRDDPLLRGLEPGCFTYFVHSYYVRPEEGGASSILTATCDYGGPFCATVWRERIWATQFHPEKSQRTGLRMLANFAAEIGEPVDPAAALRTIEADVAERAAAPPPLAP